MNQQITAIVENGILRPTEPLGLPDGTRLKLTVAIAAEGSDGVKPTRSIKERVAAIAALPIEAGPEFSGRDHDRILYGEKDET